MKAKTDLLSMKIYGQQKNNTCGPATLRTLLLHFGIKKSEKDLALICKTNSNGTTPAMMIKTLKKFGFKVKSGNGKSNRKTCWQILNYWINRRSLPVIVDWFSSSGNNWDGHYSLVIGLTKNKIFLADPDLGNTVREIPWKNFFRSWFDWRGDYIRKPEDLNIRWYAVAYPDRT